MRHKPNSTLLFHLTDELRPSFSAKSSNRPTFYWFNDSYHSHLLGDTPAYSYMYFFIVKPYSGAGLFTRHGKGDFASLWADYSNYLETRSADTQNGVKRYLEPGIVMSFSELKPNLTGKFSDGYKLTIINLTNSSEITFSLIKNGQFRRFGDIPELLALCPEIATSVPVIQPNSDEIRNPVNFWVADTENEGRSWL